VATIESGSDLVGHRLSAAERRDWRFLALFLGALLVLLAYFAPMFPYRIIQATTRFSKGTTIVAHFPVLIYRQHFIQARHPLKEELRDVQVRVAPVGHAGSGWSWLLALWEYPSYIPRLFSYLLVLLWPVLGALGALLFVGQAWFGAKGLPERWIPLTIYLTGLGPLALVLAWFHQFDFSTRLLALAQGSLQPRVGFWLALVGTLVMAFAALALRRETRRAVGNWWILVFVIGVSTWLLVRFKPYPFLEIWDFIYDGILVTLRLVITSFGFILLVSLLGGLGRISRSRLIYGIASLYVEIIRGIPLLVQLLFIWFALPQVFDSFGKLLIALSPALEKVGQWWIDLRLSPFTAAVLGLTICYGAYGSEIFRAGISSIHHGQMEAARSLGMTYFQAMRHIILPQAIRVILPPVGNEFVALLKDSSLVSVLAVSDLTRRGREYMARTFLSFDTWLMVALCYLVLTLFSSRAVEFIEAKTKFEH